MSSWEEEALPPPAGRVLDRRGGGGAGAPLLRVSCFVSIELVNVTGIELKLTGFRGTDGLWRTVLSDIADMSDVADAVDT